MRRTTVLFVTLLFLASCAPIGSPLGAAAAQEQAPSENLGRLWLDVSMGPNFVEWFNRTAHPEDIARIDHLDQLELLDQITAGQRLVVFKSLQEAEQVLPAIAGRVEIVGYNLESGPANLPAEQRDPVDSVRRMRELASRYGAALAVGPDRDFALSDGVAMAAYADIMILQVQRVQTEPQRVAEFVLPLADAMRQANPAPAISVQVAAQGEVGAIVDLIRTLAEKLDGVSVLTDHETTGFVTAFATELRGPDEAVTLRLPAAAPKGFPPLDLSPTATAPPGSPLGPGAQQLQSTEIQTDVAALTSLPSDRPTAAAKVTLARRRLWLYVASLGLAVFFSGLTVTGIIYAVPYWHVRQRKRETPD